MEILKKTPYSLLELAFIVNGATVADTLKDSVELAQKAEEMGYNRFWLAEHHNTITIASSATSVLIGHIAGHTQKIRVGSGGIMLPNHSPLIIAEQFGTLGTLYPNRIDLGLGRAPGTDQATAYAIRSDRMQAAGNFPEEVELMRNYFSDNNKNAAIRAIVAEGVNLPLYILGSSTDSAHLAAKMGLPYVFASHFSPAHLFNAIEIYRKEFRPSAYMDKPYIIAGINVIAAETETAAEENFSSQIRFFIGMLTGKMEQLQAPVPMNEELKRMRQHPAIMEMLKYSFVGSKDAVAKQIQNFLTATSADELMVVSNIYHHEERIKSYRITAEIMNELNSAQSLV